jgi:hypothetical protein
MPPGPGEILYSVSGTYPDKSPHKVPEHRQQFKLWDCGMRKWRSITNLPAVKQCVGFIEVILTAVPAHLQLWPYKQPASQLRVLTKLF